MMHVKSSTKAYLGRAQDYPAERNSDVLRQLEFREISATKKEINRAEG